MRTYKGMPCASISADTFLWECFRKFCVEKSSWNLDEEKPWVDINLKSMLAVCGYELQAVFFQKAVEQFLYTIGNLEYINAIAIVKGDFAGYEYGTIDILPRYVGSDRQWELLVGKSAESILVRFSLSGLTPLWVASVNGGRRINLNGNKLNWDKMYDAENRAEEEVMEDWEANGDLYNYDGYGGDANQLGYDAYDGDMEAYYRHKV